jgi:phage gpG-like protein
LEIRVDIDGLDAARTRLRDVINRTQNLDPALLRAGIAVLAYAQRNIDAGGGSSPWPPNLTGTPLLHRTGRLIGSLTVGGAGNIESISGPTIRVGTNVYYAAWMQQGTGIYGDRGSPIVPTNKKALAFNGIVRKSVKGSPKRPYLYINDENAQMVAAIFTRYIVEGSVDGGT